MSGTAKAAGGDPSWGAEGRGGTWRGRGPRVGRHGWRMASLLSTLPLPLPPVVAFSRNRERRSSTRSPWSHLRMMPSRCPFHLCASWAPAVQAPLSPGFRQLGLRALLPFLGLWAAALSRARGLGLSLDRAIPSPSRAPTPVTLSPPHTHTGARAQSTSRWESAPQGLLRSYPHPYLWVLLPPPPFPFHDFLPPLQASRSISSIPHLARTSWGLLSTHKKD